jgi:hypothetical protein
MYTSVVLFALSGAVAAGDSPSWLNDYSAARQQSASQQKPLAVVLASGNAGYNKLSRGDELSDAVKQTLASKYICVYVNTGTNEGQQLATDFEMPNGLGIVISDRTGRLQAFRHEGELSNNDLERALQRYADPERVARTTETNVDERTSYYGPGDSRAPAGNPGSAYYYQSGYYQGGYCASCGGCSGGRCGRR